MRITEIKLEVGDILVWSKHNRIQKWWYNIIGKKPPYNKRKVMDFACTLIYFSKPNYKVYRNIV